MLVPEDALHRVPFAALIVNGTRMTERYAVHMAPSAAIALSLWGTRPAPGPARMLAFGDAHFPIERRAQSARHARVLRGVRIERRAHGARGIRPPRRVRQLGTGRAHSLFSARTRARRISSVSPLDQYRLVHFATHAQVDERAPGRSAIALAAGGGEDGFVTSADLAGLRLNADLVMLSGCSTALGVIVDGEGILGLTGPLLQAGAHSVVATLWPVNDRASAEFVTRFYGFLAGGYTATDALRLAQLDAIRRNLPTRDWAAFVLTGDGFVRVSPSATSR